MASQRLSDEDIDRIELLIIEVIDEKLKAPRAVNISGRIGGGDGGFRKLVDGLLVIAIPALVAVVWSQNSTVSSLVTQVAYLTQEVQLLRASK